MNKLYILIILLCGMAQVTMGEQADTIFVQHGFFGNTCIYHGERLNLNQLPEIMQDNQEAYHLIGKAKLSNTVASIISGTGGFLIGWQLANAAIGGEPKWGIAALGVGLMGVSISLFIRSDMKTHQAVSQYNGGLGARNALPILRLGATPNGLGLVMDF